MSHRLYHTEGLILAARDYGEANVFYWLLTPDLGLIGASAQGVRYLKSKLRPQLGFLDHAKLTLVRGRHAWRLVGAESSGQLGLVLAQFGKYQAWSRVALLLRRLIRGESADVELYSDLLSGLRALNNTAPERVIDVETLIILRLLHRLGYVRQSALTAPWLRPDLWPGVASTLLILPLVEREQVIRVINYGLARSQL